MTRHIFTAAMLLIAPVTAAEVIGHMTAAEPIIEARIAQLPKDQRAVWLAYLAKSRALLAADKAALAAERQGIAVPPAPADGPSGGAGMPLTQPVEYYAGPQARHNADTIVSFQTPAGGWGKNVDRSGPLRLRGQHYVPIEDLPPNAREDIKAADAKWAFVGTIDNNATTSEIRFLARVQAQAPGAEGNAYRASFLKGVRYLLTAQLPNGGWPQVYPLQGGYHDAITYNDDALTDVIALLSSVASAKGDYAFVPPAIAAEAKAAVARAIQLVLDTQVMVDGKRTLWGQQHDALTQLPVGARNFEPKALSSYESASLLMFLMRQPDPSPQLKAAVKDGVEWLRAHAIRDMEWTSGKPGPEGRKLSPKPGAGPIWARYYDMATMQPIFGDRDKSIHDDVNEISLERRNGYSWFSAGPQKAIDAYAKWAGLAASALPYLDPALNAEKRAADLVARMTLAEKAAQIHHAAPAIPRLGVPEYNWWSEGLHGVARAGEATVFPQAIGLAATWDTQLVRSAADVTATEFRAKYLANRKPDGGSAQYRGLTVWSPNVNIFRDPRWGRGQETFGEDPYLAARMGVAFIRGLQGDDPAHPKTVAAVKHYAVHSGPEASRHTDDIHPSPRDLTETYLPAFRAAIIEAKAQAIMCAYNALDGVPACGNSAYLIDRLRGEWKFDGHVVSDCAAVADFYLPASHAYVKTPEEAVARALIAGTDLICDFASNQTSDPATTVRAVRQGLLKEAELDQALRRLFATRFRLGTMDAAAPAPYAAITTADFDTPAHRAVGLEAARKSLVLLKNDGLLPLKAAPRRIAVIGPNADSVDALVGNYNGTPSRPITVLAGIKARFPDARVDYVEGTGWVAPPLEEVPPAALCVDAACSQPGLTAEEFTNPRFQGAPAATRTDASAIYRWGYPTRQERDGTVRWSGYVKPAESGRYRFRYTGDAGYRIYVDDRLIADVWDIAWPTSDTEVMLEAGKPVKLRVEAAQKGARGEQRLRWSPPGAAEDKALATARDADLVVFAGGLTSKLEGEEMRVQAPGFAGGDRTSLDLPAPQQKLLEQLHATGTPVVLLLMNGSAMSVNWADANVPAIVEAWYPGGEGGQAVAELIAGDFSPSGRLPVTFYKGADQLPAFKDYSMAGRTYRYFAGEALYPFGHGLSYTHFAYAKPVVSRAKLAAGQGASASVLVTNSGARDGDEIVQLYVSRPSKGAPIRSLAGFQRVHLAKGETRTVRIDLDPRSLSLVDAKGKRWIEPGSVDLWIGGGQPVARAGLARPAGVAASLQVSGRKELPQ